MSDRTGLLTAQDCSRTEPICLISVWACHTAGIMQMVVGPSTAPKLWKSPSWQNGTTVAYPDAQAKNLHSFLHPQHHNAGQGTPRTSGDQDKHHSLVSSWVLFNSGSLGIQKIIAFAGPEASAYEIRAPILASSKLSVRRLHQSQEHGTSPTQMQTTDWAVAQEWSWSLA